MWHQGGLEEWSPAEWGNAFAGEAGELCNVLKKILRYDMSIPQSTAAGYQRTELVQDAANEIADAYAYLDLIASRLDLDIQSCVVRKFNIVSEREDLPQRFPDDYVGQW